MKQGKVQLWWNNRDKFGVIEDSSGNEYYFDASVIEKTCRNKISRDTPVEFQINESIEDTLCAKVCQNN